MAGMSVATFAAGCFWGVGEVPAQPAVPFVKVFQTDSLTVRLDDTPGAGGITLEAKPPAVSTPMLLKMDSTGIELSNGAAKIKLTPASVSVNDGALEVI